METILIILLSVVIIGAVAAVGAGKSGKNLPLFTVFVLLKDVAADRLTAEISRETDLFKLHETVEITNLAAFPETATLRPGQEWELSFYVMRGNSPTVITASSARLTWEDAAAVAAKTAETGEQDAKA